MNKWFLATTLFISANSAMATTWLCHDERREYEAGVELTARYQGSVTVSKAGKELLKHEGRFVKMVTDLGSYGGGPRITSWELFVKNVQDENCVIQKVFTRTHPGVHTRETIEDSLSSVGLTVESRCRGNTFLVQRRLRCERN